MNDLPEWQHLFENEIQQAQAARTAGNEGMARVCARRAAGIVIGEYLKRQGDKFSNPSAYERLRYLLSQPDITPQVRDIAAHFLVRVTPNHTLPIDADLIADAHWLQKLLIQT